MFCHMEVRNQSHAGQAVAMLSLKNLSACINLGEEKKEISRSSRKAV